MAQNNSPYPSCYGDIDKVFPMGRDGLRCSPDSCLQCAYKTPCLRSAMQHPEGLRVREDCVDRAYRSGMMGFCERWSRKKDLHRKIAAQRGKTSPHRKP